MLDSNISLILRAMLLLKHMHVIYLASEALRPAGWLQLALWNTSWLDRSRGQPSTLYMLGCVHGKKVCDVQERLAAEEWLAVATSLIGTVGLGVSSEEGQGAEPGATSLLRVVGLGLLFVLAPTAYTSISRWRDRQKRKHIVHAKALAMIHGLQVNARTSHWVKSSQLCRMQ